MQRLLSLILLSGLGWAGQVRGQVVGHLPEFLPRNMRIGSFTGGIADANAEAVLLFGYDGVIERFDLASKTSTVFTTNNAHGGHLIPNGFLLYSSNRILQVEANTQIDLGTNARVLLEHAERVVEGRFGILRTPQGRILRDFVAGTNYLLSAVEGYTDVAANGNVAFTEHVNETNIAVRFYANGAMQTLATLPTYPLPVVATDGTNVLWSEPVYPFGSVYLHTPTGKVELATNTMVSESGFSTLPPRQTSVLLKGGWTVFPRWAPGNPGTLNNLWRRSPDGVISQVTTKPGFALAMREDGGLLVQGGDGRIEAGMSYFPPTGPAKALGGDFPLARYFALGNKFYVYSPMQSGGSALFEIEVEADPFGLGAPYYDSQTGKFSVALLPGVPGTYVLEHSTDFKQWSGLSTNVIEQLIYPFVEVTAPPGVFRLRRQ